MDGIGISAVHAVLGQGKEAARAWDRWIGKAEQDEDWQPPANIDELIMEEGEEFWDTVSKDMDRSARNMSPLPSTTALESRYCNPVAASAIVNAYLEVSQCY